MDDPEAEIKERLDQLLRTRIPDEERRRSLIAAVPLYLWSIYGGRLA